MLAALAQVQRPFHCTVIGGGTPRHVPNVTYAGRVSDQEKAEILGRADIYVAPNTGGESFGIVLVEAMAAGCAVVASDIEAFRTVCNADSAEPAGLLFANGDSADLARSLQQLIDAPDERAVLQQRGRERAAVLTGIKFQKKSCASMRRWPMERKCTCDDDRLYFAHYVAHGVDAVGVFHGTTS